MSKRKVEEVAFHRNGVCGEPFYVVTFSEEENGDTRRMVGIVFDRTTGDLTGSVPTAVFDRDLLCMGDITFASNSWRGDHYTEWLMGEVTAYEVVRAAKFGA